MELNVAAHLRIGVQQASPVGAITGHVACNQPRVDADFDQFEAPGAIIAVTININ